MARARPTFHAELGEFFRELRETKGWRQRQAADVAARRKLAPPLTRQVLLRLEAGQTKNPEPEVLRALARLYGVSYEELAGKFIAKRYGLKVSGQSKRDLASHAEPASSLPSPSSSQGGDDVGPASAMASTRVLEEQRRRYEGLLVEAGALAQDLYELLTRSLESGAADRVPRPRQASSRRGPRRAR